MEKVHEVYDNIQKIPFTDLYNVIAYTSNRTIQYSFSLNFTPKAVFITTYDERHNVSHTTTWLSYVLDNTEISNYQKEPFIELDRTEFKVVWNELLTLVAEVRKKNYTIESIVIDNMDAHTSATIDLSIADYLKYKFEYFDTNKESLTTVVRHLVERARDDLNNIVG